MTGCRCHGAGSFCPLGNVGPPFGWLFSGVASCICTQESIMPLPQNSLALIHQFSFFPFRILTNWPGHLSQPRSPSIPRPLAASLSTQSWRPPELCCFQGCLWPGSGWVGSAVSSIWACIQILNRLIRKSHSRFLLAMSTGLNRGRGAVGTGPPAPQPHPLVLPVSDPGAPFPHGAGLPLGLVSLLTWV